MTRKALQPEEYTAVWVCALPVELAAAQALLDETHDHFYPNRTSAYILGSVSGHNVVLAILPAGQTGTNTAAAIVGGIKGQFSSINFGLMVGIAGGVPNADNDIRLGDVVVSQPLGIYPGVVQYDSGKSRPEKFERTGFLNAPPNDLLTAVGKLRAQQFGSQDLLSRHMSCLERSPHFNRELAGEDLLYEPAYNHVGGPNCDNCSREYLVERQDRSPNTIVHYGTIASGNQVMRNGLTRDKLSSKLGGVLCFEMEAAGVMKVFSCLVIRGISDYADSHKDKRWQPYAAIVAAAYAKELLFMVHARETGPVLNKIYDANQRKATKRVLETNCEKVCTSLDFTQMHHRRLVIRKPCYGTATWLSQTPEFNAWLEGDCYFLWVKGKAGSGKSTLMKEILEELRTNDSSGSATVASFFYNGSGHILEHSTIGVLRSVLHQIFSQNRDLLVEFMNESGGRFVKGIGLEWNVKELEAIFEISCRLQTWRPTRLVLDGLDEGLDEEVRSLLQFFQHQIDLNVRGNSPKKLQVLFSSRHFPHISVNNCRDVCVEHHNRQDILAFTLQKLSKLSDTPNKDSVVRSVIEKADGVFLWADLVTSRILKSDDHGENVQQTMKAFEATPQELDGLYMHLLLKLTDKERLGAFRLFSWVLFAKRRLSPLELCFAMQLHRKDSKATLASWERSNGFIRQGLQAERFIRSQSRGLLNIGSKDDSQDATVQFIHHTVPDFLLRRGLATLRPAEGPANPFGVGHRDIALTCIWYLSRSEVIHCDAFTNLQTHTRHLDPVDKSFAPHASNTSSIEPAPTQEPTRSNSTMFEAIESVFHRLPLLKYSVQALDFHLSQAERYCTPQDQALDVLLSQGTQSLQIWYKFQKALYLPRGHRWHWVNWGCFLEGLISLGVGSCISDLSRRKSMNLLVLPPSCDLRKCLSTAISHGAAGITRDLIACGADLHTRNRDGRTPLDESCFFEDAKVVQELIDGGADVKDCNPFGYTALHHAVSAGWPLVVTALLRAGAEVNARLWPSKDTPLHLAVAYDHLDVMNLLIKNGADKLARNSRGHDYRAWALECRAVAIYAALNPLNSTMPRFEISSYLNVPEPINRVMTASPSPEKREQVGARLANPLQRYQFFQYE